MINQSTPLIKKTNKQTNKMLSCSAKQTESNARILLHAVLLGKVVTMRSALRFGH